jgi:glycosyltransferase involved in cell wall biosynthesis/SAM-dependent methyltransferase
MGHYVLVLTYAVTESEGDRPTEHQVKLRSYEYEGVPVIALLHADLDRRGGLPGVSFQIKDREIFREVERLLRRYKFDLLHCIHPMRVGEVLRAAKQQGLKRVLTLMDYWMLCPLGTLLRVDGNVCDGPDSGTNCAIHCYDNSIAESLMNRYRDAQDILAEAHVILSHSRFLIDIFRRNGVDTSKFFHLSNGMDYSKAKFTHRQRDADGNTTINFGFLGTVLPHKGVHILVEAFTKVPSDNIRLKIYGGSLGDHKYYSGLLKSAKKDPRIEFCGEYDFNNVAEIIESIDVVVVPSVWYENAPLVISTAQMFGIPVIATGIGGMAEMVKDGRNGFTFGIGDVDGLAEKIRLILAKPGILQKLSQNRIPPPRIESEAFSLERLYAALVSNEQNSSLVRPSVKARGDQTDRAIEISVPMEDFEAVELARGYFDLMAHIEGALVVKGWILLPDRSWNSVHVYLNEELAGSAEVKLREDVANTFPWIPHARTSGFQFRLPMSSTDAEKVRRVDVLGLQQGRPIARMRSPFRRDLGKEVPTPSPELMDRVANTRDPHSFKIGGLKAFGELLDAIRRHCDLRSVRRLLDWGCGCGRLTVHFLLECDRLEVFGCDIDPEAIAWCKEHLQAGSFSVIQPWPPTSYKDASFDLVSGYSVFTHLAREAQTAWLDEMRRIIAPGGLFLASTHGEFAASFTFPKASQKIPLDGISDTMTDSKLNGVAPENYYRTVFQTREYTLREFSKYFEILEYIERGVANFQDLIVMRRPA